MPIVSQRHQTGSKLAKPQLVELRPETGETTTRGVPPNRLSITSDSARINAPAITIGALSCTDQRLANDTSVDVELTHAGCGISSVLYSAHNVGIGAFPAHNKSSVNPDAFGEITLIVSQRVGEQTQKTNVKVNASREGRYMLAIPTDAYARVPMWRSTQIELDDDANPTQISSLFDARTRSCMLMSIQINESIAQIEGESHAG